MRAPIYFQQKRHCQEKLKFNSLDYTMMQYWLHQTNYSRGHSKARILKLSLPNGPVKMVCTPDQFLQRTVSGGRRNFNHRMVRWRQEWITEVIFSERVVSVVLKEFYSPDSLVIDTYAYLSFSTREDFENRRSLTHRIVRWWHWNHHRSIFYREVCNVSFCWVALTRWSGVEYVFTGCCHRTIYQQ